MRYVEDLLKTLFVMASVVEARDPYTGGHLWRVSQYCRLLTEELDMPHTDVARIALGGFLHDLGKVGVPDAILNKPDLLTDAEYAVIKTHPEVGERLLAGHPLASLARAAVLCHHERPDGGGYPHGLKFEAIPIDARVVGICDAFDAMASTRPYRRGMPMAQALSIIEENLDRQFDRALGKRFLKLGDQGVLDPIVGHSEPGIPLQDCPMCGPIIVVRQCHRTGDHVYCRHCGNEGIVHRDGETIEMEFTGRTGTASDLQPEPDMDLIASLVHEAANHLAIA